MTPIEKKQTASPGPSAAFWYALPIWIGYGALAPVAVYSFVNLVVVLIVCALGVHGLHGLAHARNAAGTVFSTELTVAITAWVLIICAWSVNAADAWGTLLKLIAVIFAGGAMLSGIASLSHAHLRTLQSIIMTSGILLVAVYAIEIAFDAPLASHLKNIYTGDFASLTEEWQRKLYVERAQVKIARGVVALGAFSFPVSYLIWRRTKDIRLAGLWWIACFLIAIFSPMSAIPIALLMASGAMAWLWLFPKNGLVHLAGLATVFMLSLPLVAQQIHKAEQVGIDSQALGYSSQHRIQIYHYISGLIMERPLSGWGFRAARHMADHAPAFVAAGEEKPFSDNQTVLPLHPHNMALQLWLETGFIGMALLTAILMLAARNLCTSRLTKSQRILVAGTGAFLFVIANLSFGIWQFHWISLMILSAGAVLACCHRPRLSV